MTTFLASLLMMQLYSLTIRISAGLPYQADMSLQNIPLSSMSEAQREVCLPT